MTAPPAGGGQLRLHRRRSAQRVLRLAARLVQMRPGEIAHRLGRLVGQRIEPAPDTAAALAALEPVTAERVAVLLDEGFLFGPRDRAALAEVLGADVVARASQAARRLGSEGLRLLEQPVRVEPLGEGWRADPATGALWPDRPMTEADARAVPADIKFVWELNRHQYLPTLGRACWLAGDETAAETAVHVIDDWIAANPYGRGPNWASALEVALRAIAWLWTLPMVVGWPRLDPAFLRRWLASLAEHHHHLRGNLSVYTDPTNHLIGEATGLWLLSTCLPALPGAPDGARRALGLLEREVRRQVTVDGVSREQAFGYQRFVLEFFLQVVALLDRLGRPVPDAIAARCVGMLDFFATLVAGGGAVPPVGDGDDGHAMPFVDIESGCVRHLLAAGAVLFRRPEWKGLAGPLPDAALWLLGPERAADYARLPAGPPRASSRVFAAGGYCVFQREALDGPEQLLFDVGPLGLWPNAAHGHADALAVLVSIRGTPLLGDPGTGSYHQGALRDALRSTAAHSTLAVDGLDQADVFDTFKWVNPPRVRLLEHRVGDGYDWAVATHTGFARLRRPVRHTRAVLFVHGLGWIVVDRVEGRGQHRFTRGFSCAPSVEIETRGAASVSLVERRADAGLRVILPQDERLVLGRAPWSRGYGSSEHTLRMTVETTAAPPRTFFALLLPERADGVALPDAATEESIAAGRASLLRFGTALVVVNPQRHALDLPDGVSTDAAFVFLQRAPDGPVHAGFLAGGGRCALAGTVILAADAQGFACLESGVA
jgi:hypothetical protein